MDFSFSITWVFGIITLACAGFFLQMLIEYNGQRGKMMPQIRQVRDIRKRHEAELEKVDHLTQEAEPKLEALEKEVGDIHGQIRELEVKVDLLRHGEDKT